MDKNQCENNDKLWYEIRNEYKWTNIRKSKAIHSSLNDSGGTLGVFEEN